MDKLGLKISGITFLGLSLIFVGLQHDSFINYSGYIIGVDLDRKPIDVQTHRVTSNCDMTYHFFSSSEIYLYMIRCDELPSYQEWKHLMRYNELVDGELTKDFSDYIENQLTKPREIHSIEEVQDV